MNIRQAGEQDAGELVRLVNQLYTDPSRHVSAVRAAEILRRIAAYPCYRVYLAETAAGAVGTFSLLIMDNLAGEPSGIVEDVVVDEKHRGEGIGGAIMRFAMEECRAHGCYKLVLSSNRVREDAHRFYEKLGFRQHGISFQVELEVKPEKR